MRSPAAFPARSAPSFSPVLFSSALAASDIAFLINALPAALTPIDAPLAIPPVKNPK